MNDEVLINKKDLETLDSNMTYLSDNLDNVTQNVNKIEGRLNQVSNEFNSLQDNIKQTVLHTHRTTLVLNAKQTIMLLRQEYDRKYRYRDEIRRKIKGLIKAVDINKLKRETIEMIGQESIVNSPDYWLTPALLALCSWYTNDKESAYKYLQSALKQDAETTALLLCFIHIRAGRYITATKWLNRYLGMQNPTSIDGKIILIFDAITSGIFNLEMQEICLNRFEEWIKTLNEQSIYKDKQLDKWQKKFMVYQSEKTNNTNPYIDKFVLEKELFNNHLKQVTAISTIREDFQKIINKTLPRNEIKNDKIDKLLDILIYNCDREERQLHDSIVMNEYIISCDGNVTDATNKYEQDQNSLNDYQDFYTHITNIALNYDSKKYSPNTVKVAVAFSKKIIMTAYQNVNKLNNNQFNKLTIKIEDYQGVTDRGRNERELVEELLKSLDEKFHKEVYTPKLIGLSNIISFIIAILIIIIAYKYLLILAICLGSILVYNAVIIYKVNHERQKKIAKLNELKKDRVIVLLNILAEIVDGYFLVEDKIRESQDFITYLNSLNYRDYFTKTIDNNYRNILWEEHK